MEIKVHAITVDLTDPGQLEYLCLTLEEAYTRHDVEVQMFPTGNNLVVLLIVKDDRWYS